MGDSLRERIAASIEVAASQPFGHETAAVLRACARELERLERDTIPVSHGAKLNYDLTQSEIKLADAERRLQVAHGVIEACAAMGYGMPDTVMSKAVRAARDYLAALDAPVAK